MIMKTTIVISDFQKIIGALSKSETLRNFKTYEEDIVSDMNKIFSSYTRVLKKYLE